MTGQREALVNYVERWLRWAREDLSLAEHTAHDPDVVARGACMWAHQSAEKALKALLVAQGIDPPKTHNLLYLERLMPSEVKDKLAVVDLVSLTRWAIEGRYPDDLDEATAADAEASVLTAVDVLSLAEQAALQLLR